MLIAYIWGPDSETDVYSDWFLILTKMLRIWFLGFTAICCQFTAYYLVPMSYWGIFAGLCSKLSSDSLLKKTGYRASEAYPLKDFAGERLSTLCWKLLRLLTEEGRVPCTGNHPCIVLRKIDESCLGSFSGILRGKIGLLTPEASYCDMRTDFHIYNHLNIFAIDFLHETGFCRTILLSEYMPYFCLLPGTSSSKIILNEKLNLYLSHTFDNILSTLHTIYLLADLIILLWWVHANANLILTVHPGFLLHPDKIFPISLQSADNSILFSWVSKYMHFLLTLRVRCRLTSNFNRGKICNTEGPKKETKETTKTKAHKHTTNIINQAIITYYCYSHNNMHAHLSTQISRKLRYCGLICCDDVHEDE